MYINTDNFYYNQITYWVSFTNIFIEMKRIDIWKLFFIFYTEKYVIFTKFNFTTRRSKFLFFLPFWVIQWALCWEKRHCLCNTFWRINFSGDVYISQNIWYKYNSLPFFLWNNFFFDFPNEQSKKHSNVNKMLYVRNLKTWSLIRENFYIQLYSVSSVIVFYIIQAGFKLWICPFLSK